MPNWCSNAVIFKGDENILNKIQQFLKTEKSNFDFEALMKMHQPKRVIELDQD